MKSANLINIHSDIDSCPERTEVDIDMRSTTFQRPGVCDNVTKNHIRDLFVSIRVLAKTMLGVIDPPVAGIRVNR
jgi:hypothetical protein